MAEFRVSVTNYRSESTRDAFEASSPLEAVKQMEEAYSEGDYLEWDAGDAESVYRYEVYDGQRVKTFAPFIVVGTYTDNDQPYTTTITAASARGAKRRAERKALVEGGNLRVLSVVEHLGGSIYNPEET